MSPGEITKRLNELWGTMTHNELCPFVHGLGVCTCSYGFYIGDGRPLIVLNGQNKDSGGEFAAKLLDFVSKHPLAEPAKKNP